MSIQEMLAILAEQGENLSPEDRAMLEDLVAKYAEAPDTDPEHEAQETPETEAKEHETGMELGEPLGEVAPEDEQTSEEPETPENPVDPTITPEAPVPPVEQGETPVETPVTETPMEAPVPEQATTPDPMQMLLQEINSLRTEIQGIKDALSQVSVREPVEEEEEMSKDDFGEKGQSGPGQPQQANVMDQLIRKMGGMAR